MRTTLDIDDTLLRKAKARAPDTADPHRSHRGGAASDPGRHARAGRAARPSTHPEDRQGCAAPRCGHQRPGLPVRAHGGAILIAVDTNILVYAHREGLPQHERALAWMRQLVESPTPWALPVFCLGEFVRVVTHPRVFDPPSTMEEALEALGAFLASPSVRLLLPGEQFAALLVQFLRAGDARGNIAFDAQIATLCREQGIERILTEDRDFARFSPLRIVPLSSPLES